MAARHRIVPISALHYPAWISRRFASNAATATHVHDLAKTRLSPATPVSSPTPNTVHQRTLRLYRDYWRLHRLWPLEPNRPGRNLREHLAQRIRREFRQERQVKDEMGRERLLEEGQQQLYLLRRLLNNEYLNKVSYDFYCSVVHQIMFVS